MLTRNNTLNKNKILFTFFCAFAFAILLHASTNVAKASTISANPSVANNSTVSYSRRVTIKGQINPPHKANVYIRSRRRGRKSYRPLGKTVSDNNGFYSFTFRAGASGSYLASWNGRGADSAAQSKAFRLKVKSRIKLSKVVRPSWIGQKFYISGKIIPRHRNKRVSLQVLKGKRYKTFARGRTNRKGNFKIYSSFSRKKKYRIRVAFSDNDHALTGSKRYTLRIRKANPWNISARYRHYIVLSKRTFKLYYLRNGRIVKTFRAGVGQRRYPTPSGNFKITRKAVRPTWYPPKSEAWAKNEPDSVPWPSSPLGARGLYLNTGRIIIHGTTQPRLLDRPYRAISHGCIRLKNSWVVWLYNRVPRGTRVKIY